MRGTALISLAIAASAIGCAPGTWELTVANNTVSPVLVRVQANGQDQIWMLQAFQVDSLIRFPKPVEGAISIVDPATCTDSGASAWTIGPPILAVVDRDPTGAGDWTISISADDVTDAPLLPPIAHPCSAPPSS